MPAQRVLDGRSLVGTKVGENNKVTPISFNYVIAVLATSFVATNAILEPFLADASLVVN